MARTGAPSETVAPWRDGVFGMSFGVASALGSRKSDSVRVWAAGRRARCGARGVPVGRSLQGMRLFDNSKDALRILKRLRCQSGDKHAEGSGEEHAPRVVREWFRRGQQSSPPERAVVQYQGGGMAC